ncbi:hypothetical protein I552_1632 [Mycobacterium xenopi 3993]|nr:hypothetical protein I552_1632 [Mycobacterium xenopi 3993]
MRHKVVRAVLRVVLRSDVAGFDVAARRAYRVPGPGWGASP